MTPRPITVVYFAWLRERIGEGAETVETAAPTVRDLVDELRQREPRYALAFSDLRAVRVAVDQDLADLDASLADAREVAFFPPMTGG
jgi:sulfur-carrier protein